MRGQCITSHPVDVITIYNKKVKNKFLLPDWQRGLVWDRDKIDHWKKDLIRGGLIPGVVITFNVKGDDTVYINDGVNRTLATVEFGNDLIREGKQTDELYEILGLSKICLQHIEYENMQDAFLDFFKINIGTMPTPLELGKGILVNYLDNYSDVWQPVIEELHSSVEIALASISVNISKRTNARDASHKWLRDNYALFHRYASENKKLDEYGAGKQQFKIGEIENEKLRSEILEYKFCELLKNLGPENTKAKIAQFRVFLANQLALYETLWKTIMGNNVVPTITHIRYFLAVSIYRQNTNIPIAKFKDFIVKFIKGTHGGSQLCLTQDILNGTSVETVTRTRRGMSLSNLKCFRGLCNLLKAGDFLEKKSREKKTKLKAGYHHSHIKPFSQSGDGETVPEAGLINLERGASPMNSEALGIAKFLSQEINS